MAKDNTARDAAITGGGAVVAGTGLAAGGIPGARPKVKHFVDLKLADKGPKESAKTLARHPGVVRAFHGGALGFRHNAHAGGLYGFKQKATEEAWKGAAKDSHEAFFRGRGEGKIVPEVKIMRHLKGGKAAAAGALATGSAAVGYSRADGRPKKRTKVKKSRRSDQYNGALIGTGISGAGVSHGGSKLLGSQSRKWSKQAARNIDRAGDLVPNIAGRARGTHTPKVTDRAIRRNPHTFEGVHHETAQEAGRLRGAAVQQAHFAEVYRDTGKMVGRLRNPSLVAAGAGAGGLAISRKKKKKDKVHKSGFGVDHVEKSKKLAPLMSDAEIRRRKKVQGGTSRATSTLGLTALGLTAATISPKTYGTVGRAVKSPIKSTRGAYRKVKTMSGDERRKAVRGATVPIMAVSGGIGGVGGYNFARYTEAEARKRTQVKKDHPTSAFGVDHSA